MDEEGIRVDWCDAHGASWIVSIGGCGIGHPDEFGPCHKVPVLLTPIPEETTDAE